MRRVHSCERREEAKQERAGNLLYLMLAASSRSQCACKGITRAAATELGKSRGCYLYVRVESAEGAAAGHGQGSFRRANAAGSGFVADRESFGVGASFLHNFHGNSSGSNLLLMTLHEAHRQNLSR